ncbi:AT-rich interactive domain-containing protein 1A-like isoform X2 [Harmonia axyridis]|uniref:AT-rich interactive domain-containing protein 1A-like isoform X2 n=1 Tax=Harmonia axyridis TaxID=115357 RepID=UPI001E278643|nr:AT-rich interactive domain-containing protein 1A-like isoform X2 [Harmonia axyridis]
MKMKNVSEAETLRQVKEESCSSDDESLQPLRCWDCNVNFTSKIYLYKHLFHHIKQPTVKLTKVTLPPLKITLKNTTGNGFEIVQSPTSGRSSDAEGDKLEEENVKRRQQQITKVAEAGDTANRLGSEGSGLSPGSRQGVSELDEFDAATLDDINGIIESETGGSSAEQEPGDGSSCSEEDNMVTGPIITEITEEAEMDKNSLNKNNYETIPGAEPTPPPDPSPDSYPKIRIKTTGLLKDPIESTCTITEITDDNPNGNPHQDSSNGGHLWSTPSLEDPLKLPESDDNILSLFNNNDRAKDYGFTTSDSEYISLDRLDNRNNSGALQLYNPPTSSSQNPLDSLTGLPMQALAQQVSRLQPSGNGMHQQNVLINIQQFPQAPPQAPYQPPPMYHHSGQPPMYGQPYQYQPPNPMYYPPGPTYAPPPQHMQQPPPLPPLTSIGQHMNQSQMNPQNQMGQPPMSQAQVLPPSSQGVPQNQGPMAQQQGQYRQTIPRVQGPRQPMPGQRMPMGPRQPMNPRAPMASRQRAPMTRPRGGQMSTLRGVRPRFPNGPTNTQYRNGGPMKRPPDQIKQEQNIQAKKKRFDVLTPDKDDEDCQVICMQPKNTDGLPQIESVQGAASESAENSIMHLSDSITLSVRNPPPKPASPKKSDAKAVANILATRGITVTPTAKPKEKNDSPSKNTSPLNLNGAVSIIPSAKQQVKKSQESALPTVDLTDDAPQSGPKSPTSQKTSANFGLPYRCHLCPAQYPNALGLTKHKQNYHKTSAGNIDMGIPLINLKQPGVLQKLGQLGIHNFIPLPTPQQDGTFAIPIINTRNPANVQAMGATNMLILGPVKAIPRPGVPNAANNPQKPPMPQQK